ncbi:TolC family protein [Bacteroides xylanisolvens]|uniref:TolC family protein n=2 Tax=Bacteroides xylanisolvens TaxID=371601 RepID=A0A412W121_9BACE|nr:TolC family protein [Bacteroides xylanisolvens]
MINVRRLTVMTFLGASMLSGISAQVSPLQVDTLKETKIPDQWDLQSCIDYAKEQNITIRKNRITAASTQIDVKTAKAALFPSLSFSTGHQVVNRPYQERSSRVSGSEIISSNSKTSYNGNYGLNASWTLYNGNKRLKTIQQEKLNNQMAELDVATSENNIQESITQVYIQILYAAESVKVNENTLQVSIAQRDRGQELLNAGSIAKSDLAQLEAQVSTDRYQLVTAQATLEDYKLQLKQLLELDGENEMNIYLPALSDENVLAPLPTKRDVYISALSLRPEIEASKLNVEASELGINIAKSSYFPTISLSAGIGTNHTSGSDFTFGEQVKNGWNNSIGLSVSVPIFNNRQTKSAVQKAKLQYETSILSLLDEQKALYKTIESLWLDANSAQQRYAAANEKLKSTQISYELISEQFNLGMKNTVELLTEKNNLLQAQQEQLQAKYMAILNTQLLKFYQGDQLAL